MDKKTKCAVGSKLLPTGWVKGKTVIGRNARLMNGWVWYLGYDDEMGMEIEAIEAV